MQKDLYVKEQYPVWHDDLKFDGTNVIIPFYWVGSIEEYLSKVDTSGMNEGDITDLKELKAFISAVLDYRHDQRNYKSYHFEGTN